MQRAEPNIDTADLCRRCAEGDETAFSDVYEHFGGMLYGTAWRILKSPQEAEEVVQEAFLTLYRKAADNPPRNLGGWLHRVTVNRSLDIVRRRKTRPEVSLVEELQPGGATAENGGLSAATDSPRDGAPSTGRVSRTPGEPGEAGENVAEYGFSIDIERAIDSLPERTRMVFVLHDVEGFKHREIAEVMDIAVGSSKSQLFRARNMLRDWLKPETQQ